MSSSLPSQECQSSQQQQPILTFEQGCFALECLMRRFKSDDCLDDMQNIRSFWIDSEKTKEATTEANEQLLELILENYESVMTQFGFFSTNEGHDSFKAQLKQFEDLKNPAYDALSRELKEFFEDTRELCPANASDDEEDESIGEEEIDEEENVIEEQIQQSLSENSSTEQNQEIFGSVLIEPVQDMLTTTRLTEEEVERKYDIVESNTETNNETNNNNIIPQQQSGEEQEALTFHEEVHTTEE